MLPAAAQGNASVYDLLNIPSSARVMALGGTNITTIAPDITLAQQNPALLGAETGKTAALGYMHYLGASNFASAGFGMGAGEHAAWSAQIRYLNYGTISSTAPDGSVTGTFSPQDIVAGGSFSYDITERLRGGANLNFIYSNYEAYSALAIAVDLGINYYDEERDLSLSAVLRNMGGQVKRFETTYDRVPFDIVLGYSQTIGHSPIAVSVTAYNLTRWKVPYYSHKEGDTGHELKSGFVPNFFRHLIFGLEYLPTERIYAALAYNYKTRSDMAAYKRNFLSGFSIGAGIRVKSFSFGVAVAQPHTRALSLMLNISTDFDELLH